jgi:hypothetical protein
VVSLVLLSTLEILKAAATTAETKKKKKKSNCTFIHTKTLNLSFCNKQCGFRKRKSEDKKEE